MATENANNLMDETDVSVSDERVTMTLMHDGTIWCAYENGPDGYWASYEDMIGDRDLATRLGRKIRRRRHG